jgi:hypothetical protein
MKTITILGTLAASALFATAADAHLITIYPSTAPVAQAAPAAVAAPTVAVPQIAALPAAKPLVAPPVAAQPAPVQQNPHPVQVQAATGQPITISIEPTVLHPSVVQPLAVPTMVAPQAYQPFPPDTQRAVNCLVATGGNYVTCGINEALTHVYAEIAKCVNGVNVINGCFAPKMVAKPGRRRY